MLYQAEPRPDGGILAWSCGGAEFGEDVLINLPHFDDLAVVYAVKPHAGERNRLFGRRHPLKVHTFRDSDAIIDSLYARALRTVRAAVEDAIGFDAMTDNAAAAVSALRCERKDRALETVEHV